MKKRLIVLFLVLISIKTNAQEYVTTSVRGTIFNYDQVSSDNHQFNFRTRILDSHIVVFSNTIDIVGDILEVKMFYDITETMFTVGDENVYNNTVNYHQTLPANVNYVKMSTNVIMTEDNPPYNPITIENVYFRIFDLNNLSAGNSNSAKTVSIYPNPAKDNITVSNNLIFDKATIVNSLGQEVTALCKNEQDIYDVEFLPDGIYYISFYDKKSKVGVSKFIKQN